MSIPRQVPTRDRAIAGFESHLQSKGIKRTPSRRLILEAVLRLTEHFEAEQLVYSLKEHGHRVGRATIYRTLPLLVESGILREVRFSVRQVHYELALDQAPHDHLVCEGCGRIVEFDSGEILPIRDRIALQNGFRVTAHRLQITGLCSDCTMQRLLKV